MKGGDTRIKRKSSFVIAFAMSVLLFVGAAQADVIIDTGSSVPNPASKSPLYGNDYPYHADWAFQWLAGKIILDRAYIITDIEGWISTSESGSDPKLTMVVYGDAGGPDKGNEFYAGVFDVPVKLPQESDWRGVHGLSLALEAGAYWLALETRDDYQYSGYMEECGPDFLSSYAYAYHGNPDYTQWLGYQGFKVQGIPLDVPEPATMLLLCLGMLGVALVRKLRG